MDPFQDCSLLWTDVLFYVDFLKFFSLYLFGDKLADENRSN